MSNSVLEFGASSATESAVDFIKMYHSVTSHEFNLLRPKEMQVENNTPSLLVPIEEGNVVSNGVDSSKLGDYQHDNVNVINEISGDIDNVIVPVVPLIPPPPPPPVLLRPLLPPPTPALTTPSAQTGIGSASAASLVLSNDANKTLNTTQDDSADLTLNDSGDTTILDNRPINTLTNVWPNRYGKQPSPIYGVIESSIPFNNHSNKSNSSALVPALTLNPITNVPVRAYGSNIRWDKHGPTFINSFSVQPAMTLNPSNNMPLVKPNNAPPAMTMRSLVPLPASMSAAVATSASASLWHNPPNTPVNFNGPMQQPQWHPWNQPLNIAPWNYYQPNVHPSNIPQILSHHQPIQAPPVPLPAPPPALTWNSTPIAQNYQFQYQHTPFGYNYAYGNNNRLIPPSFTSFIAARCPAVTWNPSQSLSHAIPHFSGNFHHIGPPPFASSQTMSHSASAWNPDTSKAAQVYGSATKVWQDDKTISFRSNIQKRPQVNNYNPALAPNEDTQPSKYVVVTSQQAPTKSSLAKRSLSPNTTTISTNNNRSVTFQEKVVNIDDVENQQSKSISINLDPKNLEIINKANPQTVNYTQNVSLKFLKPPSPEPPGDITIRQEQDVQASPLSPILIQQKPTLPLIKPPPRVIRERPPEPPSPIPPVVVTIPGRVVPPPPRKVIVERLPKMPPLPSDITIERWLGYNKRTRRIKYEPAPKLALAPKPKNVLIEWDTPKSIVERGYTFLGVIDCDPADYVARYGPDLTPSQNLPRIAYEANFKPPSNETFGLNYRPDVPKLVGDIEALRLINFSPSINLRPYLPPNLSTANAFPNHFIKLNNAPAISAY